MSLSSSFVVSTLSDYLLDLLCLRQPIKIPRPPAKMLKIPKLANPFSALSPVCGRAFVLLSAVGVALAVLLAEICPAFGLGSSDGSVGGFGSSFVGPSALGGVVGLSGSGCGSGSGSFSYGTGVSLLGSFGSVIGGGI